MRLADGHPVAVLEDLARHAFAVHEHTVGALEVLNGGVIRAGKEHRVIAADVFGVEHDFVVGAASDARPAAEHLHVIGVAVGTDQDARRSFEGDLLAGLRRTVGRRGNTFFEVGFELFDAHVALQDGALALGDDRLPVLSRTSISR